MIAVLATSSILANPASAQKTQIKGFIDGLATYENNKLSFGFGEQDLFITSQLSDRLSFLGESVFKFEIGSPTTFNVSIERVIFKYNFYGNHNIQFGKIHTPINYWNDTYHHGRVFYPTIYRPILFTAYFIPMHTTGIGMQGHDLGDLKFGYDLFIGNGLGSSSILDNDKYKSITAAAYIKPADGLELRGSYYFDNISKGATVEGKKINWHVRQQMITGSVAFFGTHKVELLAESSLAFDHTDTTGTRHSLASYIYAGYKVTKKIIPYIRIDNLYYQEGEVYFDRNNTTSFVGGIRYQINYLAVLKLEYQHENSDFNGKTDKITAQIAIGF